MDYEINRPTGIAPMVVGWCCLAFAVILAILSLGGQPSETDIFLATSGGSTGAEYAAQIADAATRRFYFQVGAGACFSLFLVFWSVGYIVRAMFFLSGDDIRIMREKTAQQRTINPAAAGGSSN